MNQTENPSMMSHVSIGTNRFTEATAFYDKVFGTLGVQRVLDFPEAVAYGKVFPEFWVHPPHNGGEASVGNGVHFAFLADSPELVDAFYGAALDAGATDEGEPGPRPQYGEAYYGCFVRDLDGHKIEAMHWDESKAASHG
ncbi:VOC family protein [Microbulbifer rhizosphaerae]|uniref:Catechol 2,3-dioxygenase-like lactoylglutathione lyase family enzyme n=1 Tax=Microbulbifer rhizosphaerae TaxID=1562603 RepID=A0A7W4W967_9GAMM|nr:VOC family protein [Microbulbifer rhizosphaerae]MBB3060005.1 catechol 2,3-dioxygenase-like lactoylglutathione lyase family enzyme [Microbulbifer rhizosphaerae]